MGDLLGFICAYADQAHYIFFGLFLLAGVYMPISEDLLLLTGGALVSRCIPDQYLHLYTWMFFGCWVSGWEAYWLGRWLGPKLYELPFFKHVVTKQRIDKLHRYYEKFGIWTFIVGRFIPGGVRNALFITSGMGKMPFFLFTLRDFIASLISTNVVFYLGYTFGKHYEVIVEYFLKYDKIAVGVVAALTIFAYIKLRPKDKPTAHDHTS